MIAIILLVVLAIVLVIARAQSDKKQNEEAEEQPQKATGETWMGAFNAYDKAFNVIKKSLFFTLLTGVAMLAAYAVGVIIHGKPEPGQIYVPYEFLILAPLYLVMPAYSLAVVDGKKPSFASLYRRPLRTFLSLIVAGIVSTLIVGLSFLLLIIPIIWTTAWFSMADLAVMDKNMGPIKALKESKRLAQNHIGKVWGLVGVSFLLSLAINVTAIVPVTGPYISMAVSGAFAVWSSVAMAVLYRWLQKNVKV